jgi:hypothetical protein
LALALNPKQGYNEYGLVQTSFTQESHYVAASRPMNPYALGGFAHKAENGES